MTHDKITLDELRSMVRYDPIEGLFYAVKQLGSRRAPGEVVGSSQHHRGYVSLRLKGRNYYGHILAWFYMTGEWPVETIDHEDRNRSNNRWRNLRPASQTEQNWNLSKRAGTTSRFMGVSFWAKNHQWIAEITANGVRTYLGGFDREEDAGAAYLAAKAKLHQAHTYAKAA